MTDDGLRTTPRLTPAKIAFQLVGFAISITLFVWVLSRASSEENTESLERLRNASAGPVLLLLGLTAASIILNGLIFWVTARPIRKLRPMDVIGVNSIATFLSILPFKLGFLSRALIHRRRDAMRISDLIVWFISVTALGMGVFLPLGLIGLWRGEPDTVWWVACSVSIAGMCVCAVALGRLSNRWPWLAKLSMGSYRIVQHPGTVIASTVFRVLDVMALAGRFLVAGSIIGLPISFSQAGMHGTVYYLVSVLSPAGVLGVRETASERLGLTMDAAEQFALVALLVTFAELIVAGLFALIGAVTLRVDRLLLSDISAANEKPLRDDGGVEDSEVE